MMSSHIFKPANQSLRDDVILCYDDVIPECYATSTPYIRACTALAKWTGREAENQRDKQQRPEKEDRAGGRGKSKAKDHTLQKLVYRQQARGYTRG